MKTVLRTLSDLSVLSNGDTSKSNETEDFINGYIEETKPALSLDEEDAILDHIETEPELVEQHHDDVEEAVVVAESTTDDSNNASVEELVQIMIADEDVDEEDYIVQPDTPLQGILQDADEQITRGDEALNNIETAITENNEAMERLMTIQKLRELFSVIKLPYNEELWSSLPLSRLQDLLTLAMAENGGSIDVAKIIRNTNDEYNDFLKSDDMKVRLRLLEQKGSDYATMIATLTKMLGNDVTIKNARTTEYHAMLKNATTFITTMSSKIMQMAESMGLTIPANEFMPTKDHVPIVEGLPSDPRVLMYVLNMFYAMIDKIHVQAEYAKDELRKAQTHIHTLQEREKRLQEQLAVAVRAETEIRNDYETRIRNSSYYIIKDDHGRIVRKIDDEKPLETVADLDLRGTIDTALFFTSKSAASELAERMMLSRRFYGRTLEVKTVSIV